LYNPLKTKLSYCYHNFIFKGNTKYLNCTCFSRRPAYLV